MATRARCWLDHLVYCVELPVASMVLEHETSRKGGIDADACKGRLRHVQASCSTLARGSDDMLPHQHVAK
eukprot:6836534-Lingulodinium_polyedra.AAC.1